MDSRIRFSFQMIPSDAPVNALQTAGSKHSPYGGKWLISDDRSTAMYFVGRDPLDRSIPASVVLLTNGLKQEWEIDVLDAGYTEHEYLHELGIKPGEHALISSKGSKPDFPQEVATEALLTFFSITNYRIVFVECFAELSKIRNIKLQQQTGKSHEALKKSSRKAISRSFIYLSLFLSVVLISFMARSNGLNNIANALDGCFFSVLLLAWLQSRGFWK